MLKQAAANNARLLAAFSRGFAIDATHIPHITMLQCFVRTADLGKLYAAANVNAMKLEAFKLYYFPAGGGLGVAGILLTSFPSPSPARSTR